MLVELGPVSIQWFESEAGRCVVCGKSQAGAGLVGFKADDPAGPVCDGCLMGLNKDLGMGLIMLNTCRELAQSAGGDINRRDDQMVALMAVASIYAQGATWPRRPIAALEFVARLERWAAAVPAEAVLAMISGSKH